MPEVAVTVIVEVAGVTPPPPPPLPHPESRAKPAAAIAISNTTCKARRLLQPKKHAATASAVPGKNGREPRCWYRACVGAVIVRVVLVVSGGVTLVGLNEQMAPAGSPEEQANVTADLKPL